MGEPIQCIRCGRTERSLDRSPLPGPTGDDILASTCVDCWDEWQKAEVMVINELRLNFMDPSSQDTLIRHMREFLALDPAQPET